MLFVTGGLDRAVWYDPLFSGSAAIFGVPAVLGTAFFTLRTILGFAGAAADGPDALDAHDVPHDLPHDHAGDFSAHHADVAHHHAGDAGHAASAMFTAAEIFSVQSLAAFAGAFGWAGLIARDGMGVLGGLAVGVVAGAAMSAGVLAVFRQIRRLEAHGNVTREDLMGLEATVYVGVPERGKGTGQVRVAARGMDRIVNATSRDVAIATGGRVLVVAAGPDNTVVVQATPSAGDLTPGGGQPTAAPPLLEKGES